MRPDPHASAGAYALDALEAVERADFEDHLRRCATCPQQVAGFRGAAARLTVLVEQAPPQRVRASVLAELKAASPDRTGHPATPLWGRPRPARGRLAARLVLSAAAALLLAVGLANNPATRSDPAPTVAAQIRQDPGAHSTVQTVRGGTVTIVRSTQQHALLVEAHDLPGPPPGHAYQLWLQTPGGSMVPSGFVVAGSRVRTREPGTMDPSIAAVAAITIEPASGSTTPTTSPLAVFTLN